MINGKNALIKIQKAVDTSNSYETGREVLKVEISTTVVDLVTGYSAPLVHQEVFAFSCSNVWLTNEIPAFDFLSICRLVFIRFNGLGIVKKSKG